MTSRLVLANEEILVYTRNRLHRYPNKYAVNYCKFILTVQYFRETSLFFLNFIQQSDIAPD
jgi:hypothetical protein